MIKRRRVRKTLTIRDRPIICGTLARRLALRGEHGPELIRFRGNERVIPTPEVS